MVKDIMTIDGVTFTLEENMGEYKITRKEGKYTHTEFLGKISQDEAEYKFYNIVR